MDLPMDDPGKAVQEFLPFARLDIDEETITAVAEVLRSGWLASGPKVAEFEAALSGYLGGRPVRSQTSATAGMEMALLACGVGVGDEVITPALSFVATANVIVRVGARPVFVDVDLDFAQYRPRAGRSSDHAANSRDHACTLRRPAGGYGAAIRHRTAAPPTGHRGCGARDRFCVARPAHRQLR